MSEHPGIETASSRPRRRPALFALVFAISVLIGSLGHFAVERLTARGRVLPSVEALGVPLGGLSGPELLEGVRSLSPQVALLSRKVRVRELTFDVPASAVGLALDPRGTAERALAEGRRGSWLRQLGWLFARPFSHPEISVVTRLDPAKTEAVLAGFERAALGEPGVEGSIAFTDRVVPTYPRAGLAIVRREANSLLERALVERGRDVVVLPIESTKPVLARQDVERARSEAERSIGTPIVLKATSSEARLTFTPTDLGLALRGRLVLTPAPHLRVLLDADALRLVLDRARPSLEIPARSATFSVSASKAITVVPSALGTRLDDAAIIALVTELTSGTERQGPLPFQADVVPALTTEQAEGLHIRGFVSGFTTPFPCCEARVKNIERMAALVDGTIVRPGDALSLNALSGPRTAANGFVAGPTIVEGEMDMTVGGGVSQFATTLFNAVFDGGYEILQRQAHTYWFPRYPEGYDATLGYPLPDLAFRNDSSAGILIRTMVGKTSVRVEIYGDNDGRRVERHVSPRFDVVKPDTALEPNPELSPDETKVIFGGSIGWSVNVLRTVTFPDHHKKEERRKVTYSARTRRVETHPCRIPEDAPGHTGEKCPKTTTPDGGVSQ